ncbi:hypothetical protein FHL15_010270 [Xylaria flabelliformis]|uniref:Uncharacterized protein n=1 Tax=Xylaria flabelliformis TaxID=2512241 RepID=A0A553HLH4_9PEZI|nr:hypothetical protein FHL15_010270 [Xylaria flabelliformis]
MHVAAVNNCARKYAYFLSPNRKREDQIGQDGYIHSYTCKSPRHNDNSYLRSLQRNKVLSTCLAYRMPLELDLDDNDDDKGNDREVQ